MSDVSCRVFTFFESAATLGLLDLDEFLDGSGLDRGVLEDPSQRVAWEDWAYLSDRYVELVGPQGLDRTGDVLVGSQLGGALVKLRSALVTPHGAYQVAAYLAPTLYRCMEMRITDRGRSRLELQAHLPPPYTPSLGWFRTAARLLPTIPRYLGLPDAHIVVHELDERNLRCELTLPAGNTIWDRFRALWTGIWRRNLLIEEVNYHHQQLAETYRALQRTERRFREAFDALPHGVAIFARGRLRYANPPLCAWLGESPTEARLMDHVDPEHRPYLAKLMNGAAATSTELRLILPQERWLHATATDLHFEQQDARMLLFSDTTARRHAEAVAAENRKRLAISERMASVGTLAAGVAHEINNPLTYVAANLEFLKHWIAAAEAHGIDPRPAQEAVDEALEGSERVATIVSELRAFSRVRDPVRTRVDLHDVVRSALRLAGNELRHRAEVVLELDSAPATLADENQLFQVVVNLLVNAGQAIDPGARSDNQVTVRTGTDPEGRPTLAVQDTGRGMDPTIRDRVFDPFFTTKPVEGTGLGLAICHRIVRDLGGAIHIDSTPGVGTTVRVVLAAASQLSEAPRDPPACPSPARRSRILVVDDDVPVANAVARMLDGHETTVVHDAHTALTHLRLATPDLVLCDLMMPGTSGLELYRQLRAEDRLPPLIFMSGGVFDPEVLTAVQQLGAPLLRKPFDSIQLRRAIDAQLACAAASPVLV